MLSKAIWPGRGSLLSVVELKGASLNLYVRVGIQGVIVNRREVAVALD
jgi:hypothetical protein